MTSVAEKLEHPIWCEGRDQQDGDAACLVGATIQGRTQTEHRGRVMTLDCGETFAYTVTVRATQLGEAMADGVMHNETPRIALTTCSNELVDTPSTAYLTEREAVRLIEMLRRCVVDVVEYT